MIKIVHSQRPPRVIESEHDKGKKQNGELLLRSKLGWIKRKRKRAEKRKFYGGGGTLESTLSRPSPRRVGYVLACVYLMGDAG